jgi:rhodanese-related sulfurtransferase
MKKRESELLMKVVIISLVVGILAGGITAFSVMELNEKDKTSTGELIKEFYEAENAVHVSPHGLRKHMGEDSNIVIVDLRSQEEYEEEHIITAVNVPAYRDRDHSDYGAVERIVSEFRTMLTINPGTEFIVYCYSTPCMTGRKVGLMLAEHGIYVKHLGIGWNEWRYHWDTWNHYHEWEQTDVMDYVVSGSEPGEVYGVKVKDVCPVEGGLGC